MDVTQYMQERVDDQLNWFERKSGFNQKRYKRLKTVTLVTSGLIPFLSGSAYLSAVEDIIPAIVGFLGVVIAVAEGLLSIHKYQENWLQYRSTAEALKREKMLFATQTGPYADAGSAFPKFVEHIEAIIQNDTYAWREYIAEEGSDSNT